MVQAAESAFYLSSARATSLKPASANDERGIIISGGHCTDGLNARHADTLTLAEDFVPLVGQRLLVTGASHFRAPTFARSRQIGEAKRAPVRPFVARGTDQTVRSCKRLRSAHLRFLRYARSLVYESPQMDFKILSADGNKFNSFQVKRSKAFNKTAPQVSFFFPSSSFRFSAGC